MFLYGSRWCSVFGGGASNVGRLGSYHKRERLHLCMHSFCLIPTQSRLLEGVRQELLELMAVPHVGAFTARLLHTHRISTIQQLAELVPSTLSQWLQSGAVLCVLFQSGAVLCVLFFHGGAHRARS